MMNGTRIAVWFMGIALAACGGGGKDCVDLCTEAQAGSCTSITGNCGSFCSAVDAVEDPANCVSQRVAYQDCLNVGASVCSNSCGSQETAWGNCLAAYCATRTSEPNCMTLIQSF